MKRPLGRRLRWIPALLALPVLSYGAACAALYGAQRSLIYHPQPRALAAGEHEAWLRSKGVPIQLSVRERAGADALIYFGGNAEDVSQVLPQLAATFPAHALYLPHYRGYGGSGGEPSEAALVADALAVFDHVAARHARVAVIGRSLGSGVAMQLARHRAVSRLVLVTPFDSLVGVASEQFPWIPVDLLLADRFDSAAAAAEVRAPVALLVASQDRLVRPERSAALQRAFAPKQAELHVLAGVDHNTIGLHPDYAAALSVGVLGIR
jgi:hypothetical protein